jgi:hypothetical protein
MANAKGADLVIIPREALGVLGELLQSQPPISDQLFEDRSSSKF